MIIMNEREDALSSDKENLLNELLEQKSKSEGLFSDVRELEGELDLKGANLIKFKEEYEKLFMD